MSASRQLGVAPEPRRFAAARVVVGVLGGAAVLAVSVAGGWAVKNLYSHRWQWPKVEKAGYGEKQIVINGTMLNYGEGPANGRTPLLLIHGQGSDWKSYAAAPTDLARTYHVYAIDVPGHGRSGRASDGYTAVRIAASLQAFIDGVIGRRTVVSGHSSGGQLAALLAAGRPDLVSAVMLEDPPMLTTLMPRARNTWNWRDLASNCHEFLSSSESDFVRYYWEHQYMWKYFGEGAQRFREAGLRARDRHPGRPLALWWWPGNDYFRSLETYDPRSGDAFYTGEWDEGFDHAAILQAIEQSTIFVHTKVDYDGDILRGATDDDDAARISALLPSDEFVQTTTGHDFHNEDPKQFVRLMEQLARR